MKTTKEQRQRTRRIANKSDPDWASSLVVEFLDDIEELEKRLEICEKALEFYADPRNWTTPSGKIGITPIWRDQQTGENMGSCGQRAVEALAASRGMGE